MASLSSYEQRITADSSEYDSPDEKSKSQLKREMTALQELGEILVELSAHELERMPLPEKLYDAVVAACGMRQRGAHKRQLQYIGKVMRNVDTEPIREHLAETQSRSRQSAARQHHLERLRDLLLTEGDAAMGAQAQAMASVLSRRMACIAPTEPIYPTPTGRGSE